MELFGSCVLEQQKRKKNLDSCGRVDARFSVTSGIIRVNGKKIFFSSIFLNNFCPKTVIFQNYWIFSLVIFGERAMIVPSIFGARTAPSVFHPPFWDNLSFTMKKRKKLKHRFFKFRWLICVNRIIWISKKKIYQGQGAKYRAVALRIDLEYFR